MLDLAVGDRFEYLGTTVTVTSACEPAEPDGDGPHDPFGRSGHVRLRARRDDTSDEGWMLFGPTATVERTDRS